MGQMLLPPQAEFNRPGDQPIKALTFFQSLAQGVAGDQMFRQQSKYPEAASLSGQPHKFIVGVDHNLVQQSC